VAPSNEYDDNNRSSHVEFPRPGRLYRIPLYDLHGWWLKSWQNRKTGGNSVPLPPVFSPLRSPSQVSKRHKENAKGINVRVRWQLQLHLSVYCVVNFYFGLHLRNCTPSKDVIDAVSILHAGDSLQHLDSEHVHSAAKLARIIFYVPNTILLLKIISG